MKTNIIKKTFLCGALAFATGFAFTSCEDYLTITPTDRIVEEEFWEDKNDLLNVVNACYARLIKEDIMYKYIQWGELRSDNFSKALGKVSNNITNVQNANLLSTNNMFDWTAFYNEINYCNKVLAHGPAIVKTDESFSNSDWLPIKAEMLTLRAFCHFYLVRTFDEVPYVNVDYNNDKQNFLIEQSSQIAVLDSIINDLEYAKDIAMNDYGNTIENKGRVTKTTVYTLLADVYLWRASYKAGNSTLGGTSAESDYQKCVEYCDWVIQALKDSYKKIINDGGYVLGGVDKIDLSDLFIQNYTNLSSNLAQVDARLNSDGAAAAIFGKGNSRESIFELQIDGINNTNSMMMGYFWNLKDRTVSMLVGSSLYNDIESNGPNTNMNPSSVFTKTDFRRWESLMYTGDSQTEYPLAKYSVSLVEQGTSASVMKDSRSVKPTQAQKSNPNPSNWIVYRLSDVVLMKAEAYTQLYTDEEHMKEAFALVREVFRRSNPYAYENRPAASDSLAPGTYNTPEAIEKLVMLERQREFIGEGKRWFDLVRYAQRKGNTAPMLDMLGRKYGENKNAINAKLGTMKSLFSPVYTNELKNNSLLHQNSVWGTTESTSRTDEI